MVSSLIIWGARSLITLSTSWCRRMLSEGWWCVYWYDRNVQIKTHSQGWHLQGSRQQTTKSNLPPTWSAEQAVVKVGTDLFSSDNRDDLITGDNYSNLWGIAYCVPKFNKRFSCLNKNRQCCIYFVKKRTKYNNLDSLTPALAVRINGYTLVINWLR